MAQGEGIKASLLLQGCRVSDPQDEKARENREIHNNVKPIYYSAVHLNTVKIENFYVRYFCNDINTIQFGKLKTKIKHHYKVKPNTMNLNESEKPTYQCLLKKTEAVRRRNVSKQEFKLIMEEPRKKKVKQIQRKEKERNNKGKVSNQCENREKSMEQQAGSLKKINKTDGCLTLHMAGQADSHKFPVSGVKQRL